MAQVVIAITSGTTFTIPADFPPTGGTLKIECIGSGDGGGGAYAVTPALTGLTPLTKVFVQIGANGTDTWFNTASAVAPTLSTTGCLAKGASGDIGGLAAACVPITGAYNGGSKGIKSGTGASSAQAGYGGAAGPNGAGAAGGNLNISLTSSGGGGGGANGGTAGTTANLDDPLGGNNRFGVGGGTISFPDGTNGGGGYGGVYSDSVGGNASQDPVWTDYKSTVYGSGSGPGGGGDGSGAPGLPAGYGGGRGSGTSVGLIIVTYNTGTTPTTTYTEILTRASVNDIAWRVPYGVSSISVEAIGAGGTGKTSSSVATTNFQGGGGGGAYAKTNSISVTQNTPAYYRIWGPGVTGTGEFKDTWLNKVANEPPSAVQIDRGVLAKSSYKTASAFPGGSGTNSVGDVKYSGGNGGENTRNLTATTRGGGGGGAAGPTGAGKDGGATFNATSTSVAAGGGGGGGGSNGGTSSAGATGLTANGGNGGNGTSGAGGGTGATTAALATVGTVGGGGGGGANTTTLAARRNGAAGGQQNITAWNFQGSTFGPGGGGGGAGVNSATNFGIAGAGGGYGGGGGGDAVGDGNGDSTAGVGALGLIAITYTIAVSGTTTHPTSGVLIGPSTTVAGASTRFRAFATSGAITGAGSTIAGVAARFRVFTAVGDLIGAGATVAGTAARFAIHATSGILTAAGAVISGIAARLSPFVTHDTSGALVADPSIVFGLADLNNGLGGFMAVTAGDQINRALRLLGVLAEGEITSASVSQDSLLALDQMIDSWNTERLSIFSTQDQVFTWPAGQINRTLGPSGNFVGNRPIQVDDSTYFIDPSTGVSFGVKLINQSQYDGIAVKTVTSTYPQVMFINYEYPNIDMFIYPRPTRDLEWHFISVSELTQPSTLNTLLEFPPGYLRAFVYNLAMEIAPEFGIEPSEQIKRIAMVSKRNLKRINSPGDIQSMPYALVSNRQRFNIYSGNY